MIIRSLFLSLTLLLPDATTQPETGIAYYQGADFTDPRDGQTYPTVVLGNLRWFAANLNYQTPASETYQDDWLHAGEWGRHYNREEMKTACPEGWRIPNLSDWKVLKEVIDTYGIFSIMSPDRWNSNESASNITGFSLHPSGFKDKKKFLHQYMNASIWFNEPSEPESNWHLHVDGNNNQDPYYFHTHGKEPAYRKFAVRCVCEAQQ